MEAVRSDRDLKWRMVRENGDGLIRLGVDPLEETPRLLRTEVASVAAWLERVQRDQPHRMIFDRVVDEFGSGRQIGLFGKSGTQIGSVVLITRQHVDRRLRLGE